MVWVFDTSTVCIKFCSNLDKYIIKLRILFDIEKILRINEIFKMASMEILDMVLRSSLKKRELTLLFVCVCVYDCICSLCSIAFIIHVPGIV